MVRVLILAFPLLPFIATGVLAQTSQPGWQIGARGGVLRVDGALAKGVDAQWTPTAGGRIAYRFATQIALGVDGWAASLDRAAVDSSSAGALWGVGLHLLLTPLADRPWAADPVLDFGLEGLQLEDGEDRSAAFVFGAGMRRRWGGRWSMAAIVRNRFLTIEEEPVDDIATGRDAQLWEVALELDYAPGGHGR